MNQSSTYSVSKLFWPLPLILLGITVYVYWQPNEWGYRLFITALGLLGGYGFLDTPTKLTLTADNVLIADSFLHHTRINLDDIVTLERRPKSVTLKHKGGDFMISYAIDNLPQFCAELRVRNPAIVEEDKFLFHTSSPWFIWFMVGFALLSMSTLLVALLLT